MAVMKYETPLDATTNCSKKTPKQKTHQKNTEQSNMHKDEKATETAQGCNTFI